MPKKKLPSRQGNKKTTPIKLKTPVGPKYPKWVIPKPISAEQTFLTCPTNVFKFKDTRVFDSSHDIISQDRAVRAINMGLGIRKPGYNIYVAGIQGTGKTSVIRSFLEKWATDSSVPNDWIYVYDFNDAETPKAIEMEPGAGRKFKKCMEAMVKNLRDVIPSALQSEDYENAVNGQLSISNEKKAKMYGDLERSARAMDFVIKSTRMGIETIPIVDGRPLSEKEYGKLSEDDRRVIEDRRTQLEPEVLDFARKVRVIEQETTLFIEGLRNDLGLKIVGDEIDPLIEENQSNKLVAEYLYDVKKHMLENLLDFVEAEEQSESEMTYLPEERDKFRKYRVNVFIDNTNSKGAPVIIETNPTYYNLFGRIEKNVEHGMYLTDFTMIKAGAVHRANGGYLVLNAMDIFKTPSIWDTLKRVLKNRLGFIEDMGEQYSLLPTSGLRPIPIPLDIKVILIGNDEIYHVLFDGDEDFQKIFKIKADFDHKMPRIPANINAYASFIATRTNIENLLPFAKDGISAVVEYGSRLVEDQRFLSTQYGQLKDLTIESDYVARAENAKLVTREHVEQALDLKYQRLNLTEDHLLEMVKQEDILLQVDGMRVGQVNGLAVYDMGDYSFGKIGRITCTISTTDEGVLNIERASKLSGKIHDKGIYILSSFMNALLAKGRKLGIAAAVCFEQSYGMIDGDSATVAELVAILSAIGEIPVKQNVAMTGSLNQFGDVQPVGGINEKIEGFYKTAKLIGNSKDYMCLIPHQNVPNLMLSKEVRAAVDNGDLKIFPIKSINDAFEIVTGVPLGFNDINSLNFEKGTALHTITKKLENIHEHHVEEERHIHVATAAKPIAAAKKKSAKSRIKVVEKPKKRK